MQYYPSGLPWGECTGASVQPYKYAGKEYVEVGDLDEYDSDARWYYPTIMRTTTMDPLAEKYYDTSPYSCWCFFHEIGEFNLGDSPTREKAIDLENAYRRTKSYENSIMIVE